MSEWLERELGWDDEIEKDSTGFVLLPEGDYDFKVTDFERGRYPGGAKLPPCNKAVVTLTIATEQGTANIKHNLFLHSKVEGILCAFFSCIGQRRHGERLKMDWNRVVGATGRCKVGVRTWTGEDGTPHQSNEVKRFYEREEPAAPQFKAGDF